MWILIALVVIAVASAVWSKITDDTLPVFLLLASIIVGVFVSVTIPIYRSDAYDHIAQRDALQATYDSARSHSDYEMVSMAGKVADYNAWLASAQYWNHTQWHWWWPDAVNHVKPIQ